MSTALSATLVAGGGGADGVGDMLADLVNSEVTINAATTLTSSAFGKQHVIEDSGTPADYTVDLPAVSGNGGKLIGIRVDTSATKLFTLDGNGAETIDGETTVVLRAGEYVLLYCTGSAWVYVIANLRTVAARYQTNAGQSIGASSTEIVDFEDQVTDTHEAVTTGVSWAFTCPAGRGGTYQIDATLLYDSASWGAGEFGTMQLHKNGSLAAYLDRWEMAAARTDFPDVLTGSLTIQLDPGDTLDIRTGHGNGSSRSLISSSADWCNIAIASLGR